MDNKRMKIQSLERAFNIIELLADFPSGVILNDIAKQLSLPLSTVHRIISDLMERGYVEKSETQNVYKVGLRFVDLSSLYLNNLELKTEAKPLLMELCQQVGFSVFLATLVENEVCYIDRVAPYATMRGYSIIGQRRSLFTTSLGKALILDKSEKQIMELIEQKGLPMMTPKSITDPSLFISIMKENRERGWTADNQEDGMDFQCVGVPIYDYRNEIIAAISASWDKRYFEQVKPEDIADIVKSAASRISRRLGARQG